MRILYFKHTCGAWIAKYSGHVVSAKDIIEGGPDCNSLHVEISREVMVLDIRDCDGKCNTFPWQLIEIEGVGAAPSTPVLVRSYYRDYFGSEIELEIAPLQSFRTQ